MVYGCYCCCCLMLRRLFCLCAFRFDFGLFLRRLISSMFITVPYILFLSHTSSSHPSSPPLSFSLSRNLSAHLLTKLFSLSFPLSLVHLSASVSLRPYTAVCLSIHFFVNTVPLASPYTRGLDVLKPDALLLVAHCAVIIVLCLYCIGSMWRDVT